MARSVVDRAVVIREKYFWPDAQLNFWTIIILATSGTILGVFAEFMDIQNRMGLGTPWYVTFPLSIFPFEAMEAACSINLRSLMLPHAVECK